MTTTNTNQEVNTIRGIAVEDIHHINLNDYSDYVPELSIDGGKYGFWKEYLNLGNGKWRLTFHTTANRPYCGRCGKFDAHEYEDWECEEITTEELQNIVLPDFEEDDTHSIDIITKANWEKRLKPSFIDGGIC